MLSCFVDGQYKEARKNLDRKLDFRCPQCNNSVILKAGAKNIAHFSHKSDSDCKHGLGETLWHRKGKSWIAKYYRDLNQSYDVKFEQILGDRRTDVLVTAQNGKKTAVEFQQKDEGTLLYKRTGDLLAHVDEVIWIFPWKAKLVNSRYRATATYGINALFSTKRPIKRAKIMFYDDKDDVLLKCEKKSWFIYIEATDFGGGYDKTSKRWCELIIEKKFHRSNAPRWNAKEDAPASS